METTNKQNEINDFFELSVIDSDTYTPVMEKVNLCEVVCEEILANCLSAERSMILPVWEQDHCILPVHLSLKKDFLWKNWRRSLLPWRKRQKKQVYILCQEIPR